MFPWEQQCVKLVLSCLQYEWETSGLVFKIILVFENILELHGIGVVSTGVSSWGG